MSKNPSLAPWNADTLAIGYRLLKESYNPNAGFVMSFLKDSEQDYLKLIIDLVRDSDLSAKSLKLIQKRIKERHLITRLIAQKQTVTKTIASYD